MTTDTSLLPIREWITLMYMNSTRRPERSNSLISSDASLNLHLVRSSFPRTEDSFISALKLLVRSMYMNIHLTEKLPHSRRSRPWMLSSLRTVHLPLSVLFLFQTITSTFLQPLPEIIPLQYLPRMRRPDFLPRSSFFLYREIIPRMRKSFPAISSLYRLIMSPTRCLSLSSTSNREP